MSSPNSGTTRVSPGGGARIGRPPQWTVSRSRKLTRLYLYTTLSIEKIIRVLEDDLFKPRKNSAQKTVHNMLDNDPRYLRPDSRVEMDKRISSLSVSPSRRRRRRRSSSHANGTSTSTSASASASTWTSAPASGPAPAPATTKAWRTVAEAAEAVRPPSPLYPPPPYVDTLSEVKEEAGSVSSFPGPENVEADNFDLAKEMLIPSLNILDPDTTAVPAGHPSLYPQPSPDNIQQLSPGDYGLGSRKPPPARRQSTVLSTSTERSSSSVQDLKKRVSDCSTGYAKQISTLLKHLTISSASDLTQLPPVSDCPPVPIHDIEQPPDPDVFEAFPEPCYALPGDFINAQNLNCAGFPGQDHFSGKCWCSIAAVVAMEPDTWLLPTGDLSPRAQAVLADPSQTNLAARDSFGNTPLHLFAALEGYQEAFFGMVLNCVDVGATNSAGQTFLHVLNVEWFADLRRLTAPLRQLLAYLRDYAPDVPYTRDVYGRNFFHRAHSLIRDSEILDGILSPFNPVLSSRRDAFGFNPLANTNIGGEGPFIPPRRGGALTPLPEEGPTGSRGRNSPRTSNDEDAFLAFHARLVQIVRSSYNNPRIEDEEGRNGLHCLAEAIISQQAMDDRRNAMGTGRSLKRKHKKENPEGAGEGPLAIRLRHLEALLGSSPPVDVNHYDKQGNTVLISFISSIADDQDDRAKTLNVILETLIRAGARIEARNRRGETALMVAARLGRKISLAALLEHGANVHVRDADGKGVLQVIDSTCRAAKDDLVLYARLEACRVLLTGRRPWGVVQEPTTVQEWRVRGSVHAE